MFKLLNPVPFPPFFLILAYMIDLIAGDPEKLPHPVQLMGRLISRLESVLRKFQVNEKFLGAVLALIVAGTVYALSSLVLYAAYKLSFFLFATVSVYMVWTSIAVKSLHREAKGVLKALEAGLPEGRGRLGRIVGRDTKALTEEGVLKGVVETVSENTSDGIVAPLFYLALGGPALMMAYKAVNTLDSMVGYKNEKYLRFGWFSARLDDLANYLPARLTALLIVCTSFILGYNWKRSFRITLRDGRNHPSPNSGFPEAAVAGALGVRLAGPMSYGGVLHKKPFIGDEAGPVRRGTAEAAIRLMHGCAIMMVTAVFLFRVAALYIL